MPVFDYKAKKPSGEVVSGSLTAETEKIALDTLDKKGFYPLEVSLQSAKGPTPLQKSIMAPFQRVKNRDLCLFSRQLSDLLKAGIPIEKSLNILAHQTANRHFAVIIASIQEEVTKGTAPSKAFGLYPKIFSPHFISMVKAGETGGFLETSLARIALVKEKEELMKNKILTALTYPILLSIVGLATIIYLLTFFIPKFTLLYQDLGGALPVPTRILLAISQFTKSYIVFILVFLVIFIFVLKRALQNKNLRLRKDKILLKLPLIGALLTKIDISKFTRSLGGLLTGGVSISTALEISREAVGNLVFEDEISQVLTAVQEGKSLAEPLRQSKYIPPMVTDMVAVGEESGNLPEVLTNISDSFDYQVDNSLKLLISLIEPGMILVMAGIVGFIVIAMLLPVFSLNALIH